MAKFSSATAVKRQRPVLQAPVKTTGRGAPTFEGAAGFSRDAKSDLFLLAVTNMVGEATFYESASDRDARFANLVHQVTQEDPEWVAAFLPYLRKEMFMRSASVVGAAEYVAAGGPNGAAVIAATLSRPDEPGELLAYWHSQYGRNEPFAIKKGIARAISHKIVPKDSFMEPEAGGEREVALSDETSVQWGLYNENAAIKYDGASLGWRLGDVIERVHPRPGTDTQAELFKYLLDRRHHSDSIRADTTKLGRISSVQFIDKMTDSELEKAFDSNPNFLDNTGYTWERLLSARPGLKGAKLWERIIPSMGYMALLRNLRNFEQAGISADASNYVSSVLSDPERVAKSMQFPFRFLSAMKYTTTHEFSAALERALDLSVRNIPQVEGKTLILVDVSGSMTGTLSEKSTVERWEAGALFGVAQYLKSSNADLVLFGTGWEPVPLKPGTSVLRGMEQVQRVVKSGHLGWGTSTFQALKASYSGHDRLFIFSDMQARVHGLDETDYVLKQIPAIYNFNLAGYSQAHMDLTKGRYELGGFSDATFKLISLLERGRNAPWPWE